jgi:hypothetical protein
MNNIEELYRLKEILKEIRGYYGYRCEFERAERGHGPRICIYFEGFDSLEIAEEVGREICVIISQESSDIKDLILDKMKNKVGYYQRRIKEDLEQI